MKIVLKVIDVHWFYEKDFDKFASLAGSDKYLEPEIKEDTGVEKGD